LVVKTFTVFIIIQGLVFYIVLEVVFSMGSEHYIIQLSYKELLNRSY